MGIRELTALQAHIDKIDLLGVKVSAITMDDAVGFIEGALSGGLKTYICITGAHGIIECHTNPELREIHNNAGLVTPDGMPVVWSLRRLGAPHTTRVYGPDLLLAASDRLRSIDARHYFYGGAPGIADTLAEKLQARFPGMALAGTYCPPFRDLSEDEINDICTGINASGAQIVWVGLSTPKQETWMARVRDRLDAPVLVAVGAAFDFHAGVKRQAPVWMQRNGLEWLFRALTEPRRLGPRYLKIVPLFGILAIRAILRHKVTRTP